MTDLTGKVALVTGSTRGLGLAIALRLARLGAAVVVNDHLGAGEADDAVAAIQSGGGAAVAVKADVSRLADIDRLFAAAVARFGGLDIVVANAGVEIVDLPIVDVREEDFDRLMAVNVKGAFFTMQRAARSIRDDGRIVYVGSSSTGFATPGLGLYGTSKLALLHTVEVLAKEVGRRGVTVNAVLPTATEGAGVSADGIRPMLRERLLATRPIGRMGTVDDVADAVEYLVGPLAGFVSGQRLLLSGGGAA